MKGIVGLPSEGGYKLVETDALTKHKGYDKAVRSIRHQVNGKDNEDPRSRQKDKITVAVGVTEEGRLALGWKDAQDLAGPQKELEEKGLNPKTPQELS
ncbi:uncharacterized protein LOC131382157 [Hylobates moloch]|uniref:uncharacterized protein LOC131382157 n=1 Tax=Hylobates moloch TaxID=81572 RepID=UPI0026774906|nr:uncharacterized protein LOC131382157 [Hylobates moloch]